MTEPEPTPEKIIAKDVRPQRVYVDKETGKLWTEDEVAAWIEENEHLKKLGLL